MHGLFFRQCSRRNKVPRPNRSDAQETQAGRHDCISTTLVASQLVEELHALGDIYAANNRLDDSLKTFLQAKEVIATDGLKGTVPEADLEIALANFYSIPAVKHSTSQKPRHLRASAETTCKKLSIDPSKVLPPVRAEDILGRLAVLYSLELRTADEAKVRADINKELESRINAWRVPWKLQTYAQQMALNTLRLSELYRAMEQGRPSEREQVACNQALQALNTNCPECKNLRANLLLKLGYSCLDSQSYVKAIDYFNKAGAVDKTHKDEVTWALAVTNFHMERYETVIPLVQSILAHKVDITKQRLEYTILADSLEKLGKLNEAQHYRAIRDKLYPIHAGSKAK